MDDKQVLMFIMFVPIVMILFLGLIFINGKGASLIAGYNTMPQEEKKKYDIDALLKFVGKMMFFLSFSMIFWILSVAYEKIWLFVFGIALFIGIIVFIIIYINTGKRFKKQS